jgi:signal transduction histidine kinase
MIVNETLIKYVYNKNNFIKRFITNVILVLALFLISGIIIINSYISIYEQYKDIITNTKISYNYSISEQSNLYKDIISRCLAIKCENIILYDNDLKRDIVYEIGFESNDQFSYLKVTDETIDTLYITDYLTTDLRLIVYGDRARYVMNDNNYLESSLETIFILSILSALIIIIVNYYAAYINYKNEIYEKKNYQTYIENKLQGNVMEMIHHEINAPLSILVSVESVITDIFSKAKVNVSQSELDRIMGYYKYSINQITETITFLAKSKHIKRNDKASIVQAIEHIKHTINATHILRLTVDYDNCKELLEKYTIAPVLSIGGFMNVITVLFNNAIEAGANNIIISLYDCEQDHLCLKITDNGRGIRDTNDNIFTDSGKIIEQYGYSTKDDKGKQIIKKGIFYKILKILKIKVVSTDTTRGIGLYMNKMLLENAGGKIKLLETSKNGTSFEIKIPVKKKITD